MSSLFFKQRKQDFCFLRSEPRPHSKSRKDFFRLQKSMFSAFHLSSYLQWLEQYQPGDTDAITQRFHEHCFLIRLKLIISVSTWLLTVALLFWKMSQHNDGQSLSNMDIWGTTLLCLFIMWNTFYLEKIIQQFALTYKGIKQNFNKSVPANLDWFQQDYSYILHPTSKEEKIYFNGNYNSEEFIVENANISNLLAWIQRHPKTASILLQWDGQELSQKQVLALLRAKQWITKNRRSNS